MRTNLVAALLALAGCDRVFGLTGEPEEPQDADPDQLPDACSLEAEWTVRLHNELGDLSDPSLSSSGLEVFGEQNGLLVTSTRASVRDAFGAFVPLSPLISLGASYDFNLTADDKSAIYLAPAGDALYEVSRPAVGQEWSFASAINVLNGSFNGGIDVSADGLTLWATANQNTGASTTQHARQSLGAPFLSTGSAQVGTNMFFPTVTNDKLRLFHHVGVDDQTIVEHVRPNIDVAFGPPIAALFNNQPLTGWDIDITHDGRFMLYRSKHATDSGHDIVIFSRACE